MRISIITVCKNARHLLPRTMDSVLSQTYPAIEYIVIDGASTDGTIALLQEYEQRFQSSHDSRLSSHEFRWISEPDSGIYEAMNKGIRMATGEVLAFLNAGDRYLFPETIEHVLSDFGKTQTLVMSGNMLIMDSQGNSCVLYEHKARSFDWKDMLHLGLAHPATFYRKSLFQKVGLYDESFIIAGDLDLHMRILSMGLDIGRIDRFVVLFMSGGMSYTKEYEDIRIQENNKIRGKYLFDEMEKRSVAFDLSLSSLLRSKFSKIFKR